MKTVSDIAKRVAEGYGISLKDAEAYTKEVFSAVSGQLAVGEEVSIHGFGKFTVKETAAREGRNPATGAAVQIAAGRKVSFKPAKQLKDAV